MAKIKFNNTVVNGNNISISKNKVTVDGVDYSYEYDNLKIEITGDVTSLNVIACQSLSVTGNVEDIETTSGDVSVTGDIDGNITTVSGDIEKAGNIAGRVETVSGDIECGDIGGSVSTVSGDVNAKTVHGGVKM